MKQESGYGEPGVGYWRKRQNCRSFVGFFELEKLQKVMKAILCSTRILLLRVMVCPLGL